MDDTAPTGGTPPTPVHPAAGYRERLWPSVWIWLAAVGFALGCATITLPLGPPAALVTGGAVTALIAALLVTGVTTVAVVGGTLSAGRASVPVGLLGTVEVLDDAAMRQARGPGLDARAYLCLRGWVPAGVRVELTDPADPTPYWLVSSRSPAALAAALHSARPPQRAPTAS